MTSTKTKSTQESHTSIGGHGNKVEIDFADTSEVPQFIRNWNSNRKRKFKPNVNMNNSNKRQRRSESEK
ncbi:hypothetical protein BD560DRAFT_439436 [Blakeslea trispora]|nr:hypothetical protein BD560DRAFT_439436 [Blakeslea trispora]